MAATPGTQEWGLRMIVVSRCIRRIGDNAVDIGEQTAFLVTGEFEEFLDASTDVHRSLTRRSRADTPFAGSRPRHSSAKRTTTCAGEKG